MTTLQEHLDDLDPSAPIRTLATELAKRTAIESDRAADYLSLRPSLSGAIAVYARRARVSIGLPPERATEALGQLTGATGEPKGATTYVHLSEILVAQHAAAVLDLAVEAVAWKAAGPTSTLGGHAAKSKQAPKICPKHFLALTPSGACPVCG